MKTSTWTLLVAIALVANHLDAQNTPDADVHALVISPVIDGDKADYGVAWKSFRRDLQANLRKDIAGKKIRVEINEKNTTASEQLSALAEGGAPQVFALSCGNTATALLNPERYHYQSSFVLCDDHRQPLLYRPIFIVTRNTEFAPFAAACTNLAKLALLLNNHPDNLIFGVGDPNSLSSYRIPMLIMAEGHQQWNIQQCRRQNDLIDKVLSGEIFAACVADDVLRLAGDWDRVQEVVVNGEGINPLLTNGFPAISYGWRSDLPQELQECIAKAFENHPWARDKNFTKAYTAIKSAPVGGIVKVDHPDDLWAPVVKIIQLSLPMPTSP